MGKTIPGKGRIGKKREYLFTVPTELGRALSTQNPLKKF
jgi:hypothetical protein